MTFTSSEPVQIVVLHELNPQESKGQPIWTVDGNTVYGLSLIDLQKKSDSFEFTGAAVALHSINSKEFTTTVSVDAWIRDQPTEVIIQKIELQKYPEWLLSRANVPATIPMHKGIYEGNEVLYIITDSSDEDYAKLISEKQHWNVEIASVLADIPERSLQKLFIFKNGIKGTGSLGFQPGITGASLGDINYSPIWRIYLVEWHDIKSAKILETKSDIDSFHNDDLLSVSITRPINSDHLINCPLIDPFQ